MDKEKCIIWGGGDGGRLTYKILKGLDFIDIVAFCDRDEKLCGSSIGNIPVLRFSEISKNDYDYIIIAALTASQEIYDNLIGQTNKLIYKSVHDLLGRRFTIDISGWCNAKCKYCATGRRKNINRNNYMKFLDFKRIYDHLKEIGLLHHYNEIMLYSWGEPFLNPEYEQIVSFLYENNQVFSLSTNASAPKLLKGYTNYYQKCKTIVFSMPGFSQASYDKIHGFKFEIIKQNIKNLLENLRNHGFNGEAILSFHIYKFNKNELEDALLFANELKMIVKPIYAYFASSSLTKSYLSGKLDTDIEKDAEKELFLGHVPELIEKRPYDYQCCLANVISIHWDGKLELCCLVDDNEKEFIWKNIHEINSLENWYLYRNKMLKSDTCYTCRKLGIDYWMLNNPVYGEMI